MVRIYTVIPDPVQVAMYVWPALDQRRYCDPDVGITLGLSDRN